MSEAKPFCISKWEVWEAYKRVKANQGAAGVDEQSIADFERNLKGNLYKNPMVYKTRYTAEWVEKNGPDSRWVSQSLPWVVPGAKPYGAVFTTQNTGPGYWLPGRVYLAAANQPDLVWGGRRAEPQAPVAPGGTGVFALALIVPAQPGSYMGSWRLYADGAPFGVPTPATPISGDWIECALLRRLLPAARRAPQRQGHGRGGGGMREPSTRHSVGK